MSRYQVGCAGMFVLGQQWSYEDEDEAIVAAGKGPCGSEVYDSATGRWTGPTCQEEIDEASSRLGARATPKHPER